MTAYPRLFEPLKLGPLTLANRIVMGSMHTRLEAADRPAERLAAFYGARARGGASMIITGGVSPDSPGRMEEDSSVLDRADQIPFHRTIVDAVHAAGAPICLQILHAGRYAKCSDLVGASDIVAPINRRKPHVLTDAEVEHTIDAFVSCAALAQQAGYDGVEIMGSEGYLITQFTCPRTNNRTDRWGGAEETLVDLLVRDLKSDRLRLQELVPKLLKDLVARGQLMAVENEYRLQTREGARWTITRAPIAVPYATVNPAAAAKSIPRGSGTSRAAGTTHSSANAPNATFATTASPGLACVTPLPASFTMPASSTPGVKGSGGLNWYLPWIIRTSGKLTPAALTSTTTSPAPARGDGRSATTSVSGPPQVLHRTAFIVVVIRS